MKKSTKGIPRVTNKIIALDAAGQKAWLETVPAAHRADVEARLKKAVTDGRKPGQGQGRKVDFVKAFGRCTMADLLTLRGTLNDAIEGKRDAAVAEIAAAEAELAQRKADLAKA